MTTVVRELTPRGLGGVSVLEIRGPEAAARVTALGVPASALVPTRPGRVRLQTGDELLDEAIVCVHDLERIELHLHGSVPLVARLVELLGGREPAERDGTLEAAAERLLAEAPCEDGARILLDQAGGALRRALEELAATTDAGHFAARLARLVERGRVARCALRPATVVLAGPVNAGKSTLFNLLVGAERVIVSVDAGTTRDAIVERADLGRWPVLVVDTAGLRELDPGGALAAVERAGQGLAHAARSRADLVLWLRPPDGAGAPPGASALCVELASHGDRLPAGALGDPRCISATLRPDEARRRVEAVFRGALDLPEAAWVPGAPTPFTAAQCDLLAELPALSPVSRRQRLESCLAADPP